jgi:hypothetical protein
LKGYPVTWNKYLATINNEAVRKILIVHRVSLDPTLSGRAKPAMREITSRRRPRKANAENRHPQGPSNTTERIIITTKLNNQLRIPRALKRCSKGFRHLESRFCGLITPHTQMSSKNVAPNI